MSLDFTICEHVYDNCKIFWSLGCTVTLPRISDGGEGSGSLFRTVWYSLPHRELKKGQSNVAPVMDNSCCGLIK